VKWIRSLLQLRDIAGIAREVRAGGGARRVRLVEVRRPDGLVFPTVSAVVEIETAEGKTVTRRPELPVPFLYAWAYRLAHRLRVPLVSSIEPTDLSVDVPVPGTR
jgi:hypothetical protein